MKNTRHIIQSILGTCSLFQRLRLRDALLATVVLLVVLPAQNSAFAGSATWKQNPSTSDWNRAGNWTPSSIPNGPSDTATFATSNKLGISLSAATEVNSIVFNVGANLFTITVPASFQLSISGAGIANNSGIAQRFVAAADGAGNSGVILFANNAAAGTSTAFATNGSMVSGGGAGLVEFAQTATAAQGTFDNNGGALNGAFGGGTDFFNSSTAGNGTFTSEGSAVSGAFGGGTAFFDTSTAANGTFTSRGSAVSGAFGGQTNFFGSSRAGNGIFTTEGGLVSGASQGFLGFHETSTADSGNFTVNPGTATGAFGGFMQFNDTSTAGNGTFTNNGAAVTSATGGLTQFAGSSTAGTGTFTVNGDAISGGTNPGEVDFVAGSNAGSGMFTCNGTAISNGGFGAFIQCFDSADALNGVFTINGGAVVGANRGHLTFSNTSTAGSATLIANGGPGTASDIGAVIRFFDDTTGGTARVEVFGNANMDMSFHNPPGLGIGSIEGDGVVFLGANNLTVGGNNLSTTFSGIIQDGGQVGGVGGSLTKTGVGKLTLTKANTYTGGTTVSRGTLLVNSKTASGTGTGAVQVNAGTLGGTGKISGAVTLGTGSGAGAFLSPGKSASKPGTLTINNNSSLTFNSDSTYKCALDRSTLKATQVAAKGVTINGGAQFVFADLNTGVLTTGTVFTVINNTSASPIAGTFSNLANGSTFTSTGGTTFQASYTGGTGNDLTLTVVP